MNTIIDIKIDEIASVFVLSGDIEGILQNSRFVFSLKRLGYCQEKNGITIPYKEETRIKTLQELQGLLEKFSFDTNLASETKSLVSSYDREQATFAAFAVMAKNIRDNKFKDNSGLVKNFEDFQKTLSEQLVRPLYPLQLLSAFHMAFSQNACNFAVPGAGKTSIVYGAYAYLKSLPAEDPKHVDKLLVIGPLSSFRPWEKEYEECFGKVALVQRLSGDNKISRASKEQHLFSGNPAEITLIFHGGVESLQDEILSFLKANKTMVVVDEAHRIKNPEGAWGRSVVEIAKEAKSRIVLTGTPVPNGYEDLFNLFQFLYPYKFEDILKFHYANLVDMTQNSVLDSDRVKELTDNISPYFIRIKKDDLKLPPAFDHVVDICMDSSQREIYDFIETKYVKSFRRNGLATVKEALNKARLIRLRQAATNPSLLIRPIEETLNGDDYDSRSSFGDKIPEEFQDDSEIISKIHDYAKTHVPEKFLAIKGLLSEQIIPSGGKAIIWTIFIQNAKELQKYLKENYIESKLLIGEIEQVDRENVIDKFNNPMNTDFKVVIANPFSVAESISLHKGCHNAIYMERDYNCSNFLQSKDRIHRYGLPPGQRTDYYYILSKDSIDEVIHDKLLEKVRRMEKIIDADIPLFSRVNDSDETDLIKALMIKYDRRP